MWKFVLGFNYETCGYYTDDDSKYQVNRETEINIIKERALGDLSRTGKLMLCKIDHFWLSSGLELETGSFNDKSMNLFGINIKFSDLSSTAMNFNQSVHIFILVMFFDQETIAQMNHFARMTKEPSPCHFQNDERTVPCHHKKWATQCDSPFFSYLPLIKFLISCISLYLEN